MEDNKYQELKSQIESQAIVIDEIRTTQIKIANALLGSFDKNSVGLIEEVRTLRREADTSNTMVQMHHEQISELQTFRNDIKKLVAGIALVVPIAFEIIKGMARMGWDYLKGGGN